MLTVAVLATAACGAGAGRSDTAQRDTARADSAVQSDDGCVRGEPVPALIATGPPTSRPRFQRTGKLDATEDARLNDTTSVHIVHTGCAHFVQRFEFTVRGATRDTSDKRFWLEQGARHLEMLPATETMRGQLGQMVAALRTAAAASTPYAYENGLQASELGLVFLSVRKPGPDTAVVEIVFDYAL